MYFLSFIPVSHVPIFQYKIEFIWYISEVIYIKCIQRYKQNIILSKNFVETGKKQFSLKSLWLFFRYFSK